MTVQPLVGRRFIGVSTDVKPKEHEIGTPLTAGWTFEETDTGRVYEWDGSIWTLKFIKDDAKSFFTSPRSSFIQLFGDEFAQVQAKRVYLLEDLTDEQGGTSLTNNGSIDLTRVEDQLPLRGHLVPTFNGSSQYFSVADHADFQMGTTLDFVARVDFKTTGAATATIFQYGDVDAQYWRIYFTASGEIRATVSDGTTARETTDTTGINWFDDEIHTAILMTDRTQNALRLFVDGKLIGENTAGFPSLTLNNADGFTIGARFNTTIGGYFAGEISNFQLYSDTDEKKLYNLIPILSNPQMRETTFNENTFTIGSLSTQRLNNEALITLGQNGYTTTVINTSEGWYDIIEQYVLNNTRGILTIEIDGNDVNGGTDQYGASFTANQIKITNGIYLSKGSHILKIIANDKNASSSGYNLSFSIIELIKRDGEATDDDATSGVLFGDEINQRYSGDWTFSTATDRVYANLFQNITTPVDGDYIEGDIFIKKGRYRITITHTIAPTLGLMNMWFGGVKVIDNLDTEGSYIPTEQQTREVFLEGGKTTVKVQGNLNSNSLTLVGLSSIRFELIDGKSEGDIVRIISPDNDSDVIVGDPLVIGVNTAFRFNTRLAQASLADADDLDQWRFNRYFSGGSYVVDWHTNTSANSPIMDMGLDDSTTDLFNQVDLYSLSTTQNVHFFTIINIPRGFHDINVKVNGKNVSSGDYQMTIHQLRFTKIGENPDVENDNNQDTILNSGHVQTDQGTLEVEAL